MTHTVITFMSATPRDTKYQFEGDSEEYSGTIFGEALLQRREKGKMPFDRLLLCVTDSLYEDLTKFERAAIEDERKRSNLLKVKEILDRLGNVPEVECLEIKTGRNTNEVWDIFNAVISKIDNGEQVTFDITHGLRSIPFMVFLFAAFLKSAKDVEIKAIYYGAADLGSQSKSSPVVDLSPFVEMLDWINATEFFVQAGNAQPLAQLLEKREDHKQRDAAKTLREVSLAASLCQPFTLGEKVAQLSTSLEKAAESFSYTSQPFSVLKDRIVKTFKQFGLPPELKKFTSLQEEDAKKLLSQEWKLIEWYRNNGHMLQAISLGREYMVDLLSLRLRKSIYFGKLRQEVEWAINGIARTKREKKTFPREELNPIAQEWLESDEQEAKQIAEFFSKLADVRNQMDHAEHQSSPMSFKKLTEKAENYLIEMRELSKRWQILPSDETPSTDLEATP